jgi:cytochrome P450
LYTSEAVSFPCPLTERGLPDPHLLDAVRDHPVLSVEAPGGRRVWLVSGQEAAREALSDTARFTSMFDPALAANRADMVLLDPPEHTRMRKLAARAFSTRRIHELLPDIDALIGSFLDDMERAGPPVDLVRSLAVPLPAAVMCLVLGIPEADRAGLYRWVNPFTAGAPATSDYTNDSTDIGAALSDMYAYVGRLVAHRMESPTDDLLSEMIRARNGPDALSEEELIATTALMIIAGQETTSKAITRGVMVLAGSPHWCELASGALPADHLIEEVLRHQSPVDTAIFRSAKVDTELAGVPIKAGEQLFVSLHLANLDRSGRRDPHVFDAYRSDQGHMSFGYGPHFCLGAGLARAELAAAFVALAARFRTLRLEVSLSELTWSVGSVVNAPTCLPVGW